MFPRNAPECIASDYCIRGFFPGLLRDCAGLVAGIRGDFRALARQFPVSPQFQRNVYIASAIFLSISHGSQKNRIVYRCAGDNSDNLFTTA